MIHPNVIAVMNTKMYCLPLIAMLAMAVLLSCNSSSDDSVDCLFAKSDSISNCSYVIKLKKNFADSLYGWVNMGITNIQFIKVSEWNIDYILLNSTNDKCAILVSSIDTVDLKLIYYKLTLFSGEKIESSWQFYSAGLPTFYLLKDSFDANRVRQPHYLTRNVVRQITESDYINLDSCTVSDDFFDIFVNVDIRHTHESFLRNRG